jgi:hypothetical protein
VAQPAPEWWLISCRIGGSTSTGLMAYSGAEYSLSLNGKLFVEFVALIYLSYVKKKMQDGKLFDTWTLQGLLDELDTIELLKAPGHGRVLGEVTEKQKAIYTVLGVELPSL